MFIRIYSDIRSYHFLDTNIFGYSFVSKSIRMSHSGLNLCISFALEHQWSLVLWKLRGAFFWPVFPQFSFALGTFGKMHNWGFRLTSDYRIEHLFLVSVKKCLFISLICCSCAFCCRRAQCRGQWIVNMQPKCNDLHISLVGQSRSGHAAEKRRAGEELDGEPWMGRRVGSGGQRRKGRVWARSILFYIDCICLFM